MTLNLTAEEQILAAANLLTSKLRMLALGLTLAAVGISIAAVRFNDQPSRYETSDPPTIKPQRTHRPALRQSQYRRR